LAQAASPARTTVAAAPDAQAPLVERLLRERPELADPAAYDQMLLGRREVEDCEIRARDFRMRVQLPSRKRRYAIIAGQPWAYFVTPTAVLRASEVPIGDPVRRDGRLYTLASSYTNAEFWIAHERDRRAALAKNLKS
jgi:hypothetical protein